MPNGKKRKPRLRIIKELGRGCFGVVLHALLENGAVQDVAWKRMHKNSTKQSREFEMLTLVKGELHCVQLLDFFYSCASPFGVRPRNVVQNFLLELCDDNLESLLRMKTQSVIELGYADVKKVVFQTLLGVKCLHDRRICHRDLKPENIFYSRNVVKIGDLGSGKRLTNFECNTPYVVSRYYRAPELILGIKVYSLNIDVFAVGVIFYELLTGHLPFKGKTEGFQLLEILRHLGPPPKEAQELYRILIGWHGSFASARKVPSKEALAELELGIHGRKEVSPEQKTVPRKSKLRLIEPESEGGRAPQEKTGKRTKLCPKNLREEATAHKESFLQVKEEVLCKSRISPLWNEDLELLFKIKPHFQCFERLKSAQSGIKNVGELVK